MNLIKTRKAQTTPLSVILTIVIVLSIVILSYSWGKALMEKQKTTTTVNYMQSKLFEIRSNILEVTHEGLNSSRIIQLDISEGGLFVYNGSFCVGNAISKNGVLFNISTSDQLIKSDTWISIDPSESNTSCYVDYDNNSAVVMLGRSTQNGNLYTNSYMLWFRNVTQENGAKDNFYIINITQGTVSKASGGSYKLIVRNIGSVNLSYTIYSNVIVEFA